jgi:hypothetical protein
MSEVLLQRFLKEVPQGLVQWLLLRQTAIYQQSIELAFNEQPWTHAEAITLLPYLRRALWEADFRKAAIDQSLTARDSDHNAKNSSCVLVKAGSIILTGHCVEGPNKFVHEAESRKQNAGVNKWLNHYIDPRLLTSPVPKLDARPIYINVLHGALFPARRKDAMTVDPSTCFLRFAIPAADSNKYLAGCNWSAQELLTQYTPAVAVEPTAKNIPDEARPSIKKKA